jgi:hypothetical protein
LGVLTTVASQAARWEAGLRHLAAYAAEYGNADVPARLRADDGFRLGQWVWYQRAERRRGRLSPEREARLEAAGIAWNGRHAHLLRLVEMLEARFAADGGTATAGLLGRDMCADGMDLAPTLRRAYRAGKIDDDLIRRAEAAGFRWTGREAWIARGEAEMAAWRAAGHDGPVSARVITPSGFRLGDWVRRQRRAAAEQRWDADGA